MKDIESVISPLIKTQFPEFYAAEGSRFIDFVKQYYVWLESQGQATNASRNLFNYKDIDKTSEQFINHFKNKYLADFPLKTAANTQLLVKHATDMYGVKGTSKGIEVAMRALFNEPASVHYPSEDLFKTSDGTWVKPVYLELSVSDRTKSYIGQEIVGSRSGAKAFIESLVKKRVSNKNIQVAYLSGVRGNFVLNEFITTSANTVQDGAPIVIGSMTNLTVVNGGANFKIGDIFDVVSPNGKQGKARITSINNETGKVFFTYINALTSGGWGYSVEHSNVIIAQKMLQITNISNANTKVTDFEIFEGITQPMANLAYNTARLDNTSFVPGAVIENYYANGVVAANAVIVAVNATNNTSGYVVVSPNYGNVATVDVTFAVRESAAQTTFNPATDVSNTLHKFTVSNNTFANNDIITYVLPTIVRTFNSNAGISASFITTLEEGGHGFANNDKVVYSVSAGNTVISGLSNNATYYVIDANTTSLKLTTTPAGNAVTLTASMSGEEGHSLTKNQTALTDLSNNALYYVVNTSINVSSNTSVPNTYSFQISLTKGGTRLSLEHAPGLNETGHYFVKSLGRQATFNANSGVANATDYITTSAAHDFTNNDVVLYLVATGNTALANLSDGAAYCVINANTTSLQLSDTLGGTAIPLTATVNETGHLLKKVQGSGVISAFTDRTASGTNMRSNAEYIGVSDITNPFVITPYARIRGAITNTTAVVANVSTGTGASFKVGLLTDTEQVLLTPDFLHSNNTQNVVFSTINLNGNNSGTFLQFGANGVNESTFNAYSGIANTTDTITTTVAHSFANDNPVVYSVAPGNTALSGLTVGTTYYVVNTDAGHTTLRLSTSVGGAAINITSGSAESGHYLRLQKGVFYVNANSGVSNTTSFITTVATPHTFVNSTPVVYRVSPGNTTLSGLTNNATYFVANTVSNTQFQLSSTRFPITRKINAQSGISANYITPIVNTVSFNSNTGVVNTGNYIVPGTAHNFVNGDIVTYTVATGNTALTGLVNSFSYFVWNANSTAFQIAATERSANNIPVTSGVTETGHTFTRYHGLINTNIVQYVTSTGNTAISGLTNNQYYYVVNANTTSFQLATDFYYDVPNQKTYNVVTLTAGLNQQGHTLTSIIPVKAGTNETGHLFAGAHHDLSTSDGTFGGFGFVKFPLSTMDAILIDCLRFDSTTIGSIASIVSRNTGQDYNVDPFVTVVDPWTFGYYKHDYLMNIQPLTGAFVAGEQIQQSYSSSGIALTANSFSGTAANGDSTSTVLLNEKIYQSYANGAERASGFVYEGALSGGAGTIKLRDVTGTFVVTSNTTTQLKSLSSGGTANISYVDVVTLTTTARAIVKEVANSSFLKLKRINLENTFAAGNTIIGQVSGATATVLNIDQDLTLPPIGINANITANVQTANAVAKTLAVYDSGFGYYNQEEVTLTKEGSNFEITAIVELVNQGVGEGFYSSTRGFLDSDKKLHDNDYYQEYSYEITTKIPFDKYFDVLKKVMHVAGTKAFGKVEATSVVNSNMTAINNIEISS